MSKVDIAIVSVIGSVLWDKLNERNKAKMRRLYRTRTARAVGIKRPTR